MLAIITYDQDVLIEYDTQLDGYISSSDEGRSYPYELYEDITLANDDAYLIYLDDKELVPTTVHDKWLALDEAILYLKGYQSTTSEGQNETDTLLSILIEFSELNIM